ncbi:MAG: VRR-NUC domain-containing protein [Clostridium sp.]
MLEKDIESWLNKQVEQIGGLAFKFVSPGNPGVPDRIYILPNGKVWFVELKQQFGRIAGIQKWQRQRLLEMGCNYCLVRGMEGAKDLVRQLKEGDADEVHSA